MTQQARMKALLELDQLTPPIAEQLLKLRFSARAQARMHELADKSTEGSLTVEEREEYENYVKAIDVIAVLKAQADSVLSRRKSQ